MFAFPFSGSICHLPFSAERSIKETVDPQVMQEAIERRRREKKHAEEQKNREKAEVRKRELEEKAKKDAEAKNRRLREEAQIRWDRDREANLVPKGERPTWRDHLRRMGRSRKGSEAEREERYKE